MPQTGMWEIIPAHSSATGLGLRPETALPGVTPTSSPPTHSTGCVHAAGLTMHEAQPQRRSLSRGRGVAVSCAPSGHTDSTCTTGPSPQWCSREACEVHRMQVAAPEDTDLPAFSEVTTRSHSCRPLPRGPEVHGAVRDHLQRRLMESVVILWECFCPHCPGAAVRGCEPWASLGETEAPWCFLTARPHNMFQVLVALHVSVENEDQRG